MRVLVGVLVHFMLGHGRPQFGQRHATDFTLCAIVAEEASISESWGGNRHGTRTQDWWVEYRLAVPVGTVPLVIRFPHSLRLTIVRPRFLPAGPHES